MPAKVIVLYPTTPVGATFNLDYYLKTHMPLVLATWKDFGMTGYSVEKLEPNTASGAESPYSMVATLEFESMEKFKSALGNSGAAGKIMGDIPNFSNREPLIIPGDVVGTS